eukprot:c23961_g1_i1 orf=608-1219(-)
MGSRKAMEDLRATASSDVYRPPTLQPGLGPPRCPRCSAPLSKDLEASGWTIAPFVKDSFAMIGTAVGGTVSAFYGFNHAMPPIRRWITGPVWLQFAVGLPPLIIFSISCAGLADLAKLTIIQISCEINHLSVEKMMEGAEPVKTGEGGALPAFAQLAVSSYHATSAASHSAISQMTMHVERREDLQNLGSATPCSQPPVEDNR